MLFWAVLFPLLLPDITVLVTLLLLLFPSGFQWIAVLAAELSSLWSTWLVHFQHLLVTKVRRSSWLLRSSNSLLAIFFLSQKILGIFLRLGVWDANSLDMMSMVHLQCHLVIKVHVSSWLLR